MQQDRRVLKVAGTHVFIAGDEQVDPDEESRQRLRALRGEPDQAAAPPARAPVRTAQDDLADQEAAEAAASAAAAAAEAPAAAPQQSAAASAGREGDAGAGPAAQHDSDEDSDQDLQGAAVHWLRFRGLTGCVAVWVARWWSASLRLDGARRSVQAWREGAVMPNKPWCDQCARLCLAQRARTPPRA